MQVLYTGLPQDFPESERKKITARIAKVSKLVDGRGEKELHVYFQTERHLTKAEVTLNYYGHSAVGAAKEPDAFKAFVEALDKLEKQVTKLRAKWRDTKRTPAAKNMAAAPVEETAPNSTGPRINRVPIGRKPMTVDEALLVIERNVPYLPFRDVETGKVSVLIRRDNGNFDLIET